MTTQRTLVTVFLRGGADGLTLVPPLNDSVYEQARPTLKVTDGFQLNNQFLLNPLLSALVPVFKRGDMAVIPACGSDDDTRSHFYAQDLMEHGGASVAGGWLGRFLRSVTSPLGTGVLDAVSIGGAVNESLRGAPNATAFTSLADVIGSDADRSMLNSLQQMYAHDAQLGQPALAAIAASNQLDALRHSVDTPQNGANYPTAKEHGAIAYNFGQRLRLIARLIQGQVGMRSACIDLDGWDSHFVQQTVISSRLQALGQGLAAFVNDLGPAMANVSIVVMSEFGRRVAENTSLGTDHGRGGVLFVIGGGVTGGVHGHWSGLTTDVLEGPGDVPVNTDYRDVLWPVLQRHGAKKADDIFSTYDLKPLAI